MSQTTVPAIRFGPEGQVYCNHDLVAAQRTSNTAKNPNRQFYACSKGAGDPDKCNFFKWGDEIEALRNSAINNPSGVNNIATPTLPSPSTPRKRPADEQDSAARQLATEKRRKLIEESLKGDRVPRPVPTTPSRATTRASGGTQAELPSHSPAYSSQIPLTPPSSQDDNPFSSPGRGPRPSFSQEFSPSSSRGKQRALPLFKEESQDRSSILHSESDDERTVEFFADHVDAMNGLYEHAIKLEAENRDYKANADLNDRKRKAAELSSEAKARKIAELNETMQQRDAYIKQLEAQVKQLQEDRARDGRTMDALSEAIRRSQ